MSDFTKETIKYIAKASIVTAVLSFASYKINKDVLGKKYIEKVSSLE